MTEAAFINMTRIPKPNKCRGGDIVGLWHTAAEAYITETKAHLPKLDYFFMLKLKKYRTPKPIPRGGNRNAIIIKIRRSPGGLSFLEPGDGAEAQLQEFRLNTEGYCS